MFNVLFVWFSVPFWPAISPSFRCPRGLLMHAGGWRRRTRLRGHRGLVKALMTEAVMKTAMKRRSHLKVTKTFLVSKTYSNQSVNRLACADFLWSVWFIIADQQCADLQSDLEDFDLLESDGSDCEPKPQFLREDSDANPNTELSHGHLAHNPDNTRHGKDRLSPDCPQTVQQQNNTFYANPDPRSTASKPKIWSIAHTAASLDGSLQPEYPPCMLSSTGSLSPGYPSNMALTKAEREQESPVASLREWVDGVFHGPPFQQPKPADVWKGLNDAMIDSRTVLWTCEDYVIIVVQPTHNWRNISKTDGL